MKTKILTDPEYLAELKQQEREVEEKKARVVKRKHAALARKEINFGKTKKKKQQKVDSEVEIDEDDEIVDAFPQQLQEDAEAEEEESTDEYENDEAEKVGEEDHVIVDQSMAESDEDQLLRVWTDLSPPVEEDDILQKWYGVIYTNYKGRDYLYVAKAIRRFLQDTDGPVTCLEVDCLKPQVGTGAILESIPPHLPRDVYMCPLKNIIAGPLVVTPLKAGKWDIPDYTTIKELFQNVVKMDREKIVNLLKQ